MNDYAPAENFLFTSESVTEGHPDKLADQISDAVLDALVAHDPMSRVACETFIAGSHVVIGGEVTTTATIDIEQLAREVIREVGYTDEAYGIDGSTATVQVLLGTQSPDIAQGVDSGWEQRVGGEEDPANQNGAGDQGMMFGFATDETESRMPLPIVLAHGLTRRLAEVRRAGTVPYLRPDGKAQVTVRYVDGEPAEVVTVVVSTQHDEHLDGIELTAEGRIRDDVVEHVIRPVLGDRWHDEIRVYVNPTGKFVLGGPYADAGLTGRKIIVDTYGGFSRHGGGAFSGKDATKVDRSGAYAARWVARNVIAAGLATRCEVQLAYAIGVAEPVSVMVECFGTETVATAVISRAVAEVFDLRPAVIIRDLDLRRPIYRQTAAYGHFGRTDVDLPWEHDDRADALRAAVARLRNGSSEPAATIVG